MREILFRGKRKDIPWEYGGFVCLEDGVCIIDPLTEIETYVDEETVGQYTGLTDKNGKRIFEGDIVKLDNYQTGEVVQIDGTFGIGITPFIDWDYLDSEIGTITGCDNTPHFCRNDNFASFYELMWNYNQEETFCDVVEVIGNIHDNSDLLKGGIENIGMKGKILE